MDKQPKVHDIIQVDELRRVLVSGKPVVIVNSPLIVINDTLDKIIGEPEDLNILLKKESTLNLD